MSFSEFTRYLSTVLLLVTMIVISLQTLHQLQLASYQASGYRKWLKRGGYDYFKQFLPAVLIFFTVPINNITAHYIVISALLSVQIYVSRPKKAKKPLVYTWRVKRILAAQFIIFSALACLTFFHQKNTAALLFVGAIILVPIWTLLAHFSVIPIQYLINLRFINEAKSILQSMPDLTVIGITGSYGKTSVKQIAARLLASKYETLATPENFNTTLGVVRTVRERLKPTHEVFLCEMGARHEGDIKEICDLVAPCHGIITAVEEQHLDTFKTLETVAKTKFELADSLTGTLFLNIDSEPVRANLRPNAVTYAIDREADYRASNILCSESGSEFTITEYNEPHTLVTPLLGRHNALNITGAVALARKLGVSWENITREIANLSPVKHRLELLRNGDTTIIDDAYNANPKGVRAALETLALFSGTKILITPGMVELGERQAALNREFGAFAAKVCDRVFIVGEKPGIGAAVAEGLKSEGFTNFKIFDDVRCAMDEATALNGKKVILLANDLPDNY